MENQRIRITKKMLKNALLELLREQPIGKITIYDLCRKAEINRTTFYKYYGSQYELLDEIETNYFEELEHRLAGISNDSRDGLVSALRFIEAEKEHWTVLINAVNDEEFARRLFDLPIIGMLFDSNMENVPSENQRGYIRLFVCHGAYAIVRQWLNKEHGETPEEIAALILSLAQNVI